jgi:hypothetical protein
MPAPHYIIHIGPPKTGSSHLQACLRANVDALERAGIHLATRFELSPDNPTHQRLPHMLRNEDRCELERAAATWHESGYRKVIITCEYLTGYHIGPLKAAILRGVTAGAMVTVVFYIRRWTKLLASTWTEYVKQGSVVTLPEVLVHNLRNPIESPLINIAAYLGAYPELFGYPALRLICYDSVVRSGTDMFQHFTDNFLDGLKLKFPADQRANPSPSPAKIELMRLFNCLSKQTGLNAEHLRRLVSQAHIPAQMTALLELLAQYETSIETDDADQAAADVLAANQRTFGMCTLEPAPADRLYEPGPARLRYIDPAYGLVPGFAEGVWQLWNALHGMMPQRA